MAAAIALLVPAAMLRLKPLLKPLPLPLPLLVVVVVVVLLGVQQAAGQAGHITRVHVVQASARPARRPLLCPVL